MAQKICLTGIKPTEMPHLGNYIGAIKPTIKQMLSPEYSGLFFIADYHALISTHNKQLLNSHIYAVAATWLACGLNSEISTLYKQSDIPEITEFAWILNCFTSKGLLNRAHAYKDKLQKNKENNKDPDSDVSMGLYNYPILMASDILFINSDLIPVGEDQLQHIEIARDIASSFNYLYGDLIKLPQPLYQKGSLLVGLDGRKMSKSYGNHIPLFTTEKKLKKMINKIVTDSSGINVPKNTEDSSIFNLYKHFATPKEIKDLKQRYKQGIGWGEAKLELFNIINNELKEKREKYYEYINNKELIDNILHKGALKVRRLAKIQLNKIKQAIGVIN